MGADSHGKSWLSNALRRSQVVTSSAWRKAIQLFIGQMPATESDLEVTELVPSTTAVPPALVSEIELFAGDHVFREEYADYLCIKLEQFHGILTAASALRQPLEPEVKSSIVFQLRTFWRHPFVGSQHIHVVMPFLCVNDPDIYAAACEAISELRSKVSAVRTETVTATAEWFDDEIAVVRFQHPCFGIAEREFRRTALPPGVEAGDSFELEIALGKDGRVCGYLPVKNGELIKRQVEEWEEIVRPELPEDLDDKEEMERYNADMTEYLRKVLPLRVQTESGADSALDTDGLEKGRTDVN